MTKAKAKKTVVALGGAGIGVEVVDATCELLTGAGFPIEILMPPHADAAVKSHGVPVPDETQRLCREADGVLFGAAGGPPSSAVVMWLRWQLGTFASVRPARHYPGASSALANPEGIDLIILRENSEGMYPGREGDLADLKRVMPDLSDRAGTTIQQFGDGQFAVKVVTEAGAARIARFACDLARRRKAAGRPGKVTCVTKSNVLPRTDGLFQKTAEKVVRSSPDLSFEHFYVDDACRRLVRFPQSMDVVLCMNQYGDILSDIAAEVAGGLGMAPSGCYAPDWAYFESVHGSAPDIAGKGIANPTGTILSAAMMLDHIGLREEAARLEAAVARVYRDGRALTPDQGGKGTTKGFADAVLAALRNA